MNVYVLHDVLAEESGPLFEAKNDAVAVRQVVNDMDKIRLKMSEFLLVCIGSFNHGTNEMIVDPHQVKLPDIAQQRAMLKEGVDNGR